MINCTQKRWWFNKTNKSVSMLIFKQQTVGVFRKKGHLLIQPPLRKLSDCQFAVGGRHSGTALCVRRLAPKRELSPLWVLRDCHRGFASHFPPHDKSGASWQMKQIWFLRFRFEACCNIFNVFFFFPSIFFRLLCMDVFVSTNLNLVRRRTSKKRFF